MKPVVARKQAGRLESTHRPVSCRGREGHTAGQTSNEAWQRGLVSPCETAFPSCCVIGWALPRFPSAAESSPIEKQVQIVCPASKTSVLVRLCRSSSSLYHLCSSETEPQVPGLQLAATAPKGGACDVNRAEAKSGYTRPEIAAVDRLAFCLYVIPGVSH